MSSCTYSIRGCARTTCWNACGATPPGRASMLVRTVRNAVVAAVREAFPDATDVTPEIEVPRDPSHGDYSTNIGLMLAKPMKKPPRALADDLAARLRTHDAIFESVEVAGPGFVNVRLAPR